MRKCPTFVSPIEIPWPDPRPNRNDPYAGDYLASLDQWATTPCIVCGIPWRSHVDNGPGWVQRSNAERVRLGLNPNIVLGEE